MAHVAEAAPSVGSPLYRVLPDHVPGLMAAGLVPVVLWWMRRRGRKGGRHTAPLLGGYRRLPAHERFLTWLLLVTAAIHSGLVLGESEPALELLFALDAVLLLAVTHRLVSGRRYRLPAGLLLAGSISAYAIAVVASEPPDQAGLATKLVELAALGVVLRPSRQTRMRQLAASASTVSLVVFVGLAAWTGAFVAANNGGDDHHGAAPMPGTMVRLHEKRAPTKAERSAARTFYRRAVKTLAKYRDPAVAGADGFEVGALAGTDFHAGNPTHTSDGRIFDPTRPESLVYAETSQGPALLGAVYEMPSIGRRGPAIGGPLTEWHAHENVCVSLTPPAFSGLVSPFGGCAVGSIAVPITSEMIHVWLAPGAPSHFGDLDEKWRASYLASFDVSEAPARRP